MASKEPTTTGPQPSLPFGTIEDAPSSHSPTPRGSKKGRRSRPADARERARPEPEGGREGEGRSAAVPGGPAGRTAGPDLAPAAEDRSQQGSQGHPGAGQERRRRRKRRRRGKGGPGGPGGPAAPGAPGAHGAHGAHGAAPQARASSAPPRAAAPASGAEDEEQASERGAPRVESGMYAVDKGGIGVLHRLEALYRPSKGDIYVPNALAQREKLREGSLVTGRVARGHKHKLQLIDVQEVDGKPPGQLKNIPVFKNLTSIDPDFHYAVGDVTGEVSMRIVDLLCPIGRGQRGLIVAPPRSGKTTLMRQFAAGIEKGYPDVKLFVLLIDERPEEATEWKRSVVSGQVFASTADETAKSHIQLAEAVWMRACRLVELGEDVVILLDSITRLARAYNNQAGSGRTMSGGLDSRAMERPRKIFGSARNTVQAGSLTILGTTLVDTGSRMDQLVFEEFKGTGNMELVLNRKLADRRIFPAIDVERSGTRKEEKLVGTRRLKLIHTLRRVLSRMNFVEAMELLITRLEDVEKTDDFLARFEVDPEA